MNRERDLSEALTAIANDGVICYPTEGVWGLCCHPQSQRAFERILALKQRPADKGVILLAGNMAHIADYAKVDDDLARELAHLKQDFVTCILPKARQCPDYVSGQFDSVAVRLTNYEPLRQLCLSANTAIVSTSANISGNPPVRDIDEARATFGERVDVYVDMPLGGQNKPSRIVMWQAGEWGLVRE